MTSLVIHVRLCVLLLVITAVNAWLSTSARRGTEFAARRATALHARQPVTDVEAALSGLNVVDISSEASVDLKKALLEANGPVCLVLGTYAADFNALEYAQRVSFYLPALKAKGIDSVFFLLNASPAASKAFKTILQMPDEVKFFSDCDGAVGRSFGVNRGWRADDAETSPYVKLFGMLFGLGAMMTLPSVVGGYVGNPFSAKSTEGSWIQESMRRNQAAGLWPDTALVLSGDDKSIVQNKFDELPLGIGQWGRRPFELATLRLQNMLGISLKNWKELKPTEEELQKGLLTQLGGLLVINKVEGRLNIKYSWIDDGICDVCNFDTALSKI